MFGLQPFAGSIANKEGVLILMETEEGVKFGAFTSLKLPFPNSTTNSYKDEFSFLFNATDKIVFPTKEKDSVCVHTRSKHFGLHPSLIFTDQSRVKNNSCQVDLMISR